MAATGSGYRLEVPEEAEQRRSAFDRLRRMTADAAGRLADNAESIAGTFSRAADLHDQVAATSGHPLRDGAAEHAAVERRLVEHERHEAERLRAVEAAHRAQERER